MNFLYPTDLFPFTDEPETDAGITDAVLARAKKDGVVPKIFYTNGSYEYWGRNAALIHISPDGKKDAPPSPDTRIYYHGRDAAWRERAADEKQHTESRESDGLPLCDARAAGRHECMDHRWHSPAGIADSARRQRSTGDASGALAFPKIPGVARATDHELLRGGWISVRSFEPKESSRMSRRRWANRSRC